MFKSNDLSTVKTTVYRVKFKVAQTKKHPPSRRVLFKTKDFSKNYFLNLREAKPIRPKPSKARAEGSGITTRPFITRLSKPALFP